jgi:hypothetical protein
MKNFQMSLMQVKAAGVPSVVSWDSQEPKKCAIHPNIHRVYIP